MITILAVEVLGAPPVLDYNRLLVGCFGSDLIFVKSTEEAETALNSRSVDILLVNAPTYSTMKLAKIKSSKIKTILYSNLTMEDYALELRGEQNEILDHFVYWRDGSKFSQLELLTTLQKLIRSDIFGLEKYLEAGYALESFPIVGTSSRDELAIAVDTFCHNAYLSANTTRRAKAITEELLMNAIYDAPVAAGLSHYEDKRSDIYTLEPNEQSTLSLGCDSEVLMISVRDPFGAFRREKFYEYATKILHRNDNVRLIDTKSGGAGLGIFKMLYDSQGLIVNIKPGTATEVMAIIELNSKSQGFSKMGRSLHYFNDDRPLEAAPVK